MAGISTIAALTVALDLDKSQYQRKLKAAQSDGEKAKLKLERVFSRVALGGAAAAGIVMAANALGKMAEAGGRALTIQAAFNRATGDGVGAIESMREATMGLVSDTELMTQANMALTLGSANNAQQFSELAKTAQQLGRALGLDTAFALNSLNVGIARQSRLVLDNLGLIVSVEQANIKYAAALGKTVAQLTDLEKKEAFRIEAMEMAKEKLEALGPTTRNAGDAFVAFRTEMANTFDMMKKGVAESDGVMKFFDGLTRVMEDHRKKVEAGYFEYGQIQERNASFFSRSVKRGQLRERAFELQAQRQQDLIPLDEYSEEVAAHNRAIQEVLDGQAAAAQAVRDQAAAWNELVRSLRVAFEEEQAHRMLMSQLQSRIRDVGMVIDPVNHKISELGTLLERRLAPDLREVGIEFDVEAFKAQRLALNLELLAGKADKAAASFSKLGQFTGILGSVANFFSFGGAAGIISKVASGIGLVGQVGSMADLREHPGSGVVVNINGPGLETLVDTITVQQGRSRELRRVRRV